MWSVSSRPHFLNAFHRNIRLFQQKTIENDSKSVHFLPAGKFAVKESKTYQLLYVSALLREQNLSDCLVQQIGTANVRTGCLQTKISDVMYMK